MGRVGGHGHLQSCHAKFMFRSNTRRKLHPTVISACHSLVVRMTPPGSSQPAKPSPQTNRRCTGQSPSSFGSCLCLSFHSNLACGPKLPQKINQWLMQAWRHNPSQPGRSGRSTCRQSWFGEHTADLRCRPWAHRLGRCPGCRTSDCRSRPRARSRERQPRPTRSQWMGCHSGSGWWPRPPAIAPCQNHVQEQNQKKTTSYCDKCMSQPCS